MSNEMIEKVAKALALKHWPDDSRYVNYIGAARVAIQAMREPTDEMINIYLQRMNYSINCEDRLKAEAINNWQAMIDAALNEKT